MNLPWAPLTSFAVTLAVCPPLIRVLWRLGLLDRPTARSSHDTPTPRGGGVAVAAGAICGLAFASGVADEWKLALLTAPAAFALLGLAEDVIGVPTPLRLALQGLIASAAVPLVTRDVAGPALWQLVFGAGLLIWLVSYVNAFNFMDGINGISAAQAVVAGIAWSVLGLTEDIPSLVQGGLIIAAAAAGFAPFNFPHARLFLGDNGSYFIGAWLGVLVVIGLRSGLTVEAAVAPLLLYLTDTAAAIVRRLRAGAQWYQAHCDHAYQRLTRAGWSHARTTLAVASLIGASSLLGAVSLTQSVPARIIADFGLAVLMVIHLIAPALVRRDRGSVVALS